MLQWAGALLAEPDRRETILPLQRGQWMRKVIWLIFTTVVDFYFNANKKHIDKLMLWKL